MFCETFVSILYICIGHHISLTLWLSLQNIRIHCIYKYNFAFRLHNKIPCSGPSLCTSALDADLLPPKSHSETTPITDGVKSNLTITTDLNFNVRKNILLKHMPALFIFWDISLLSCDLQEN